MCLLEFAMNFEPFYAKKLGDSEESIDVEKEEQPTRQRPINLAHSFSLLENPEEIVEAELEDEVTESTMTNEQFQNVCAAINLRQREFFNTIIHSIQDCHLFEELKAFHQPERFDPAAHLWRLFNLVELTENMRQGDTTFADLLNALRVVFSTSKLWNDRVDTTLTNTMLGPAHSTKCKDVQWTMLLYTLDLYALFAKGQEYVALSRVRSLHGLRTVELDCSKLTGKTS
ncbi:ATP-dependent DNA helicase [Trichonephila inaurata madagascariensis]|uniref:ATP-dependent DNA helicase n=1 Tax=Trichonephila inaurata madagascariensis TaxID=2747483 RepID=A0A8X6XTU6_9ARAC|nr:ATP-dependent DNA helicase [Trichonephila inaurata madagascariensis]